MRLISVIDDDVSVRRAVGTLLRAAGYEVRLFDSGSEFLQSDAASTSSCIISDIQMSGMNGFDVHRQMRKREIATPIIFITAYYDEHVREQAASAGVAALFAKPFAEGEFLDAVRSTLGPS